MALPFVQILYIVLLFNHTEDTSFKLIIIITLVCPVDANFVVLFLSKSNDLTL